MGSGLSGWPGMGRPGCLTTATSRVSINPTGQNSIEHCDLPPSRDVSQTLTQVGTDEAPPSPPPHTILPLLLAPHHSTIDISVTGPVLYLLVYMHLSDVGEILTTLTSTTRSWTIRADWPTNTILETMSANPGATQLTEA